MSAIDPIEMEVCMTITAKDLISAANAVVPRISTADTGEMIAKGALLPDVRDIPELEAMGPRRRLASHSARYAGVSRRCDVALP